jgi:hypothetical protein
MEEYGPLNLSQIEKKVGLTSELLHVLEDEELYWYKRNHENWLLKGDNNTEYFHRVANGRKSKQTIYSVNDGNKIVQGTKELLKLATEYYKNLFGPGTCNMFDIDPRVWQECENVTRLENEDLTRTFLEEEI